MPIGVSNPNVPIFPPRVCTLVLFIIISLWVQGGRDEGGRNHKKRLGRGEGREQKQESGCDEECKRVKSMDRANWKVKKVARRSKRNNFL